MRRFLFEARKNREWLVAIAGMVVLAAAIGAYILRNEGLSLPWDSNYAIQADFANAQALTPGQGEDVTVAGVKVGLITNVQLVNGVARVTMTIDHKVLPAVYENGTAFIRPRTGLQDMTIALDPGSPPARKLGGNVILPVTRTLPEINVDEVLSLLDSDTRAWFETILSAGGHALSGNAGPALRTVLKASAPPLAETQQVSAAIAARRVELRRAIGNLRLLTDALAQQQSSIGQFVSSGAATFQALASQDRQLQAGLQQLPPTLSQANQTLVALRPFATAAAPALTALLPAAHRLPSTLTALDPLFKQGAPAVSKLAAVSVSSRPLVRALPPTFANLATATPSLTTAFSVLRFVANELLYVPKLPNHSFLFWLSWFAHNANSFLGNQDANGAFWRGEVIVSCDTALASQPALEQLLNSLTTQLNLSLCGKGPS
jgi:phospholipid/cholesterol/gamma-HCH transport system substrate-binding protein